jgi:hypothetical protein
VEERSIIAKRMLSFGDRITNLIACVKEDSISTPQKIDALKNHIYDFTLDLKFKRCKSMGEILETVLAFVKRNYENVTSR